MHLYILHFHKPEKDVLLHRHYLRFFNWILSFFATEPIESYVSSFKGLEKQLTIKLWPWPIFTLSCLCGVQNILCNGCLQTSTSYCSLQYIFSDSSAESPNVAYTVYTFNCFRIYLSSRKPATCQYVELSWSPKSSIYKKSFVLKFLKREMSSITIVISNWGNIFSARAEIYSWLW